MSTQWRNVAAPDIRARTFNLWIDPSSSPHISRATSLRSATCAISLRAHWRSRPACRARRSPISNRAAATLRSRCSSRSRARWACRSTSCSRRRARRCASGHVTSSRVRAAAAASRVRSLIPERVPDELLNIMEFAPGASMRGSPHLPGTREFFTCLAGEVTIFVAGDRFDLAAGDVLAFPGNVPHSYKNRGRQSRRARRVRGDPRQDRSVNPARPPRSMTMIGYITLGTNDMQTLRRVLRQAARRGRREAHDGAGDVHRLGQQPDGGRRCR